MVDDVIYYGLRFFLFFLLVVDLLLLLLLIWEGRGLYLKNCVWHWGEY
jgi:hypothetical protein